MAGHLFNYISVNDINFSLLLFNFGSWLQVKDLPIQ